MWICASFAVIRLALVGSMPSVTVTAMPGFRSAMVARWPRKVISVNELIENVFGVLSSLIVIDVGETLEITVSWCSIGVVFGRGRPLKPDGAKDTRAMSVAATRRNRLDLFIPIG